MSFNLKKRQDCQDGFFFRLISLAKKKKDNLKVVDLIKTTEE